MTSTPSDLLLRETIERCTDLSSNPSNLFFAEWKVLGCRNAMSTYLSSTFNNSLNQSVLEYNSVNQQYVEQSMTQILNNYSSSFDFTDDTSSDYFNNFQFELLSSCLDPTLPGVCDTFLTDYCSNVTRQEAQLSRFTNSMCGCYVEPDQTYLQYTKGNFQCINGLPGCLACSPDGTDSRGSNCYEQPSCDPLCHRSMTIQKYNKLTGTQINCPQNICVIDESNASVTSDQPISFINVCTGCDQADGCLCVVNTPKDLQSNVYSLCSGESVYLQNGQLIGEPQIQPNNNPSITYGIIFVVVVIVIALLFVTFKNDKTTRRLPDTE